MTNNNLKKWYEDLWIYKFIKEWQTWREVKKVYKKNKDKFLSVGLKSDWFGRMYKVINRDVKIELGSSEDEILLHNELEELTNLLVSMNLIDILAYELKPLEEEDGETYEHGYLIVFTPAYSLDRQYVNIKSVSFLIILLLFIFYIIAMLFIL